jgi:hypothetical protein
VRRFLLLAAAGVVSLFCSGWGFFAWVWGGAGRSHAALAMLVCLFPLLSVVAFWLYFVVPRAGVIAAWLMLTGTYVCLWLRSAQECARATCTASDSLRIAWDTLAANRLLWLLAFVALVLMLDFTGARHSAPPRMLPHAEDQPAETPDGR